MEDEKLLEILGLDDEFEHIEFKAAKNSFGTDEALKYCAAMANSGGGHLILGAQNKKPRLPLLGTSAFPISAANHLKLRASQDLGLTISVTEKFIQAKRIVIIGIPSRPLGRPVRFNTEYLKRAGESVTGLSEEELRLIFAETINDFTSQIIEEANLNDLSSELVEEFRRLWLRNPNHPANLETLSFIDLLPTRQSAA